MAVDSEYNDDFVGCFVVKADINKTINMLLTKILSVKCFFMFKNFVVIKLIGKYLIIWYIRNNDICYSNCLNN